MKMLSQYYKEKYGCKVYKLSLDGGFTCPNRDGTLGHRGCVFCTGAGEFAQGECGSVQAQLEAAKSRISAKNKGGKYMAYFQSFTNTYAPLPRLEALFTAAMEPEDVVGLSIATRPDCLGEDVIALLAKLNQRKDITVELGLQTTKRESVQYIRRGYGNEVYFDAVRRLKEAGLSVVTHIILGLPGETMEDAAVTTRDVMEAGSDGVKFHLLHVLRGTDLADHYEAGRFECLTLEEYGAWLQRCFRELREDTVIHRITGDGAKRDLIAPQWSADKKRVLNYLYRLLGL